MRMKCHLERIVLLLVLLVTMLLCICAGSVAIPVGETLAVLLGRAEESVMRNIILRVRLPRVANVALMGAALSLCGAAMQGLLRNPLADGSTLGVSGGASLGAVLALALGLPNGVMPMAMSFAFVSLVLILTLAYGLDRSLSTNSIILIGIIFSMFTSSLINLIISFADDQVRSIAFWTMGSLSGTTYEHTAVLAAALALCGSIILGCGRELNAFAIGEENARHIGVNVKRIKLVILIAVSALIGVCVSIGGTIGFVGLVVPHMTRMLAGPNHRRLLPCSVLAGSIFLLMADLIARTILSPIELSIGVVTSLVGALAFVFIFYRSRKGR